MERCNVGRGAGDRLRPWGSEGDRDGRPDPCQRGGRRRNMDGFESIQDGEELPSRDRRERKSSEE